MTDRRILLSVPHMGGDEPGLVADAFASNWLSSVGPHLDAFEKEMAARIGPGRIGLGVTSGTAALHLVLRWLGVGPGDRVACSTLTFAGSCFPIAYVGATPVFIDSEEISGNIDPDLIAEYFARARRENTLPKVLIAVHLYGQHADCDRIAAICEEYGVMLVEDAAESLGATYKGRQTATTARLSILSFNGNKIITTTGGGMIIADDPAAIARMRKWATQAREPALEYLHTEIGHNYRLSNVLAAIGRGQLRVLDLRVQQRRTVFDRYAAAFAELPGIRMQAEAPWGTHTRWLSVGYIDLGEAGLTAPELIGALDRANIESRPVWRPMHTQPVYAGALCIGGEVAERLYRTGICLPSTSSLSAGDQDRVIDAVRRAVLEARGTRQRAAAPVSRVAAASS